MPDWEELVRQRFSGLLLEPRERNEILPELASYLEKAYQALCDKGMPKQDAMRGALSQVSDWKDLRQKIQTARQTGNTMNPRVTRFWLPSLLTLTLAMSLPMLLARLGLDSSRLLALQGQEQRNYSLTVYAIWMVVLPLVAALGAYLSHRSSGTLRVMILSAIFLCWYCPS